MNTIEQIRDAFHLIHRVATGQSDRGYMSIPADPERDADLIVAAAIDELEALRAERDALRAQVERLKADHDFEYRVAEGLKAQVEAARKVCVNTMALGDDDVRPQDILDAMDEAAK